LLVLATISGKMRRRWMLITAGDSVMTEMSPCDLDKAPIVGRLGKKTLESGNQILDFATDWV